jgi:hypothetical protein
MCYAPCRSCKNRRFEELSASFIRETRIAELGTTLAVTSNRRSVRLLLVTANVSSSPILVTLMKEALSSSETSVLIKATRRNTQKTPFYIVTAVKTSDFTQSSCIYLVTPEWIHN